MHILHFSRKPYPHQYSIEGIFAQVRAHLSPPVRASLVESSFYSRGLRDRWRMVQEAKRRQREGDLNHIVGDVHFLAFGLEPRRTILTIHDLGFLRHPSGLQRQALKYFWLAGPVRRSRLVTVISEATKADVLHYLPDCPEEKIRVIPDMVSEAFVWSPKPFPARPTVLQVGTKANKNLPRLIEAMRGLDCRLQIIGPLSAALKAQLEAARIDYLQAENLSEAELVAAYQASDLLAFASTLEGFGLPIVEAQATGRPVLTSNCSSMPEVAGGAACLVDPFAVDSIRQGLQGILTDAAYRKELVSKGRENVRRFLPQTVASQYQAVYQEVFASL